MKIHLTLLTAIILVESSGNDFAIGDKGKALGPLQIHKILVDDVNQIYGTHYQWSTMTNRTLSVEVAELYFDHYGKSAKPEYLARIWNGGPRGNDNVKTLPYWEKVKSFLNEK